MIQALEELSQPDVIVPQQPPQPIILNRKRGRPVGRPFSKRQRIIRLQIPDGLALSGNAMRIIRLRKTSFVQDQLPTPIDDDLMSIVSYPSSRSNYQDVELSPYVQPEQDSPHFIKKRIVIGYVSRAIQDGTCKSMLYVRYADPQVSYENNIILSTFVKRVVFSVPDLDQVVCQQPPYRTFINGSCSYHVIVRLEYYDDFNGPVEFSHELVIPQDFQMKVYQGKEMAYDLYMSNYTQFRPQYDGPLLDIPSIDTPFLMQDIKVLPQESQSVKKSMSTHCIYCGKNNEQYVLNISHQLLCKFKPRMHKWETRSRIITASQSDVLFKQLEDGSVEPSLKRGKRSAALDRFMNEVDINTVQHILNCAGLKKSQNQGHINVLDVLTDYENAWPLMLLQKDAISEVLSLSNQADFQTLTAISFAAKKFMAKLLEDSLSILKEEQALGNDGPLILTPWHVCRGIEIGRNDVYDCLTDSFLESPVPPKPINTEPTIEVIEAVSTTTDIVIEPKAD